MAKSNSIKATCNQVSQRVNNSDVRFNIVGKESDNGGNINISINKNGDQSIASGFEPGAEYEISINKV